MTINTAWARATSLRLALALAALAAALMLLFSAAGPPTARAGSHQPKLSTAKVVALHEAMDKLGPTTSPGRANGIVKQFPSRFA